MPLSKEDKILLLESVLREFVRIFKTEMTMRESVTAFCQQSEAAQVVLSVVAEPEEEPEP